MCNVQQLHLLPADFGGETPQYILSWNAKQALFTPLTLLIMQITCTDREIRQNYTKRKAATKTPRPFKHIILAC
jgi:hypothetical protein